MRNAVIALASVVGGLVALTAIFALSPSDNTETEPFREAAVCASGYTRTADAGKTLIVDGAGREDLSGASVQDLECVLTALGTPEAVKQHMWSTRALDGRQQDTWARYSASWSYHPDDGLDLVIRSN